MVGDNRPSYDGEFSEYFAARAHALRNTAHLLCGDWHRAEDITQLAMLKLYVAWPRLARRDSLDAYARRVVVRTFLAENRRGWRRREQLTEEPPDTVAPTDGDSAHRLLLVRALAAVPPRQRAVLVLRYWNDLSVDEVAAALGCSTGTVKSQAARGLATLRQRLGPHFTEATTEERSDARARRTRADVVPPHR
ncbi:SigE family RNA polymerase sigma factor [Actinophytocola gossypii]|uniref:SigE family RNA polymerase sigma factor n=1 Tax=Actinophytocola gossypii TaxID=2812003 RepID=A0ABT2JCX7_9PSEU|nr:SigE family RNA polymerase sigma factor [Actinophytocola gossypii]MCT2585720.1 SigE family RNA polymerase sigma factor [Actinophytocola gossypii]